MQILHWLIKVAHDQARDQSRSNPSTFFSKKAKSNNKTKSKQEVVLFRNCGRQRRRGRGARKVRYYITSNPLAFLCRRNDVAKDCFYSTLDLKRVGGSNGEERWMHYMKKLKKKKKEEEEEEVGNNQQVGNKALPVAGDSSGPRPLSSAKPVSRMKELVRWAAGTKSAKNGKFHGHKFRNKAGGLKEMQGRKGKLESSSTSAMSMASYSADRAGNWITTDSEFVVLEL